MNRSSLRSKSSSLLALTVVLAAVVTSCATVPPSAPVFDVAGWATAGQSVQARVAAPALAVLRGATSTSSAWTDALGRVETLWVGLPDPVLMGNERALGRLRVGIEGRFPPIETAWALFWNRPPSPWAVLQPGEDALLVARGTISPAPLPLSDEAGEWGHDDFRLVWDQPGPSLLGPMASRLVELRRLVVKLHASGQVLSGQLRLELPDERAASAATVLLRLFGSSLESQWNQTLDWRADGSTVVGEPVLLTQQDLVNLLINLTLTETP